jgi:hypothetical protein
MLGRSGFCLTIVDALRVYEVQFEKLDSDYLEYWVKELKVESVWKRLRSEAEVI